MPGVRQEIWAADIAANLFKNNEFLLRVMRDDDYVVNSVVNLSISGAKPTVTRDRSSLPATISQRTDSATSYNLVEFTTSPTVIRYSDELETSYDKRQNVLFEHIQTLQENIGDYGAFSFVPTGAAIATNIVATTGTNRAVGIAPGATGTRKRITKTDVLNLKRILDNQNVPATGRVLLLPAEMYNDLLTDNDVLSSFLMNQGNLPEGAINRLWGFDVYMRSSVAAATVTTNVVKDPTAATAATDNAVALAWHPQFVRFALGETKVFIEEDKVDYYGSAFSALVRAGGRSRYTDFRGVAALVEAP